MFKQLMITVLAFLGIQAFAKDKDGKMTLTEEQRGNLVKYFGDAFTEKFIQGLAKESAGEAQEQTLMDGMVADMQAKLQESLAAKAQMEKDLAAEKAEKDKLSGIITEQKATIETMSKKPEPEPPVTKVEEGANQNPWVPNGKDTHLFGQDLPFMAMENRPYNQRAYAAMAARHGILMPTREASSLDYTSLKSDLGDYYRIRKQDRIQSFLQELPSLTKIFNLESGYQDQAVLVNMFLTDEFSQADSTALGSLFDNMVKGGYKFEPEVLTMYDVMFAHKFTALKEIEKSWIGYLNREGSSTMKWSFIEYILVETAKKLKNEQEIRRIRGVRKNPTVNVPGTSIQAANGLLKFIKNQIALFKVKPFELGEWNSGNIANYIRLATQMVPEVLRDSGRVVLYMSTDALSDYHKNLETLYGLNQDYTANLMHVKEYPSVKIVAIPGMAPSKRFIWTIEGNISLFEDKPGEMMNFLIEQQDWTLKVWSNWRESVWAYLTGRKYASAAEMPSDYSTQLIFCNDVDEPASFYINMDANDTTPSVLNHTSLVSVANTVATAITDIDDCAIGQEVRIKCGNATNAITIAKSGKFSILSAAWNPEVGDVLTVKKRSDGKFIELKRETVTSDAIAFTADDVTPDVAAGDTFITVANSVATAITIFDNAIASRVYTIYGGSDTNSATIANAGNFVLTGAMTLAEGTYIKLQLSETDSLFYEIERG